MMPGSMILGGGPMMGRDTRGDGIGSSPARAVRRKTVSALFLALALLIGQPAMVAASDHADPVALGAPESNITDLFFFPQGDQMILIFNIVRALLKPEPYDLSPFSYEIHMDLTTPVSFQDDANRARYGGTVLVPDQIHPDVTIKIRLNDDVSIKQVTFTGLAETDKIRQYFNVRDDPFVFPRFFGKNVISMVMSIPLSSFPKGQHDFILWGSTSKDGALIDHVGRSIRSQLPRFGFLNTLPPKDHLKALMEHKAFWDDVYNFLHANREWWSVAAGDFLQFTLQLRKYDLQPDVMIYTDRFPVGYPNGRVLTDDVVAQTCSFGDCLLQEISFIEGGWPRATVNDKPFTTDWPFEAAPWPNQATMPAATGSAWPYVIGLLLLLALFFWGLVEIIRRLIVWLFHRWWQRVIDA